MDDLSELEFGVLVFQEKGKLEFSAKNFSE